jgi:hypothetical protein
MKRGSQMIQNVCGNCRTDADPCFDTAVFLDWRRAKQAVWTFCSFKCRDKCIGTEHGEWCDAYACMSCNNIIARADTIAGSPNWQHIGKNALVCRACAVKKVLEEGFSRDWFLTPYVDERRQFKYHCFARACSNDMTENDLLNAGYTKHLTSIAMYKKQFMCVMLMFIDKRSAHVIELVVGTHLFGYVRPNGARARAAARLMCCAHRFCKGSALAKLPRDVVNLLAKAVLDARFDLEWLYLQ